MSAQLRAGQEQASPGLLTFCSFALTFWFAICMCRTQSLRPSFVMEASAENDVDLDDSAALSVEDIFGRVRGSGGRSGERGGVVRQVSMAETFFVWLRAMDRMITRVGCRGPSDFQCIGREGIRLRSGVADDGGGFG